MRPIISATPTAIGVAGARLCQVARILFSKCFGLISEIALTCSFHKTRWDHVICDGRQSESQWIYIHKNLRISQLFYTVSGHVIYQNKAKIPRFNLVANSISFLPYLDHKMAHNCEKFSKIDFVFVGR